MAHSRSRFVLLCQQSLAVGLVAAITAPAANLVSLDIVSPPRELPGAADDPAGSSAGSAGSAEVSVVASRPVKPVVSTVPFTRVSKVGLRALDARRADPAASGGAGSLRLAAATTTGTTTGSTTAGRRLAALSAPTPVNGLATVGVTWAHAAPQPEGSIAVSVRTRRGATWSTWKKVPYHPDEGPDPRSAEGRAAVPGTDPIYVGKVDDVQVRALTDSGAAPVGMKISLVNPGRQHAAVQGPGIDTGNLDLTAASTGGADDIADARTAGAVTTPKPKIFSRAQWGADERMRDKSSLHYGKVHGGFVHHTVNANGYTRAQVPAIIRGIYAFHTQSRGWSDVGYNFLIDRFGRIWEGRAGGVGRPVVGAHTLGYNDDAFAASAIGNYQTRRPTTAMLRAFGRLFAWKLGLHGVHAGARRVWITKRYLHAISGHRDVGQTACPGKYLYAKIPYIRRLAAALQRPFGSRNRLVNMAGGPGADFVVRDKRTRRAYVIRTGADGKVAHITRSGTYLRHANRVISVGDWNRDGHSDFVTRSRSTGLLYLYRGNGRGRFAAPLKMSRTSFAGVRILAGVGDVTGDGHPDLMGETRTGTMRIYPGYGRSGLGRSYFAHSHVVGGQLVGLNQFNDDGAPDVLVKRSNGRLALFPGNGPGGLMSGRRAGSARGYNWVIAVGDITGDRRTDLVARATGTGKLWVLPGRSRGFGPRRAYSVHSMNRFDLAG